MANGRGFRYPVSAPRVKTFEMNGFVGMRDQRSTAWGPGEALAIYNMVPEVLDRPSKLLVRRGFKRVKPNGQSTAVTVSTTGAIYNDGLYCPFRSGAKYVILSEGELYVLDLATFALTKVVTAAQLVSAGITATLGYGLAFFNDKLVVGTTDPSAKPWTWNGTTGDGLDEIAAAPNGAFCPAVRSAKLFFIVSLGGHAYGEEMVWSEENDETVGYDSGGYNNAWRLFQTSQAPLAAIIGTNAGLYVWRLGQGILCIRGEVNDTFQTTSTRDGISTTIGTQDFAPFSHPFVTTDGEILFCDQYRRPCMIRNDQVVELWRQMPRRFSTNLGGTVGPDRDPYQFAQLPGTVSFHSNIGRYFAGHHTQYGLNYIALPDGGTMQIYLFHPTTDRLVGIWTPGVGSAAWSGFDYVPAGNTGLPILVNGFTGAIFAQDPYGALTTNGVDRQFNDEGSADAGTPVVGTIIGPPHGWDQDRDLAFDDAVVVADAQVEHQITLAYVTSEAHKGTLAPPPQTFQEAATDAPHERRMRFGLRGRGRWLIPQWRISAAAGSTSQAGCYGYILRARVVGGGGRGA